MSLLNGFFIFSMLFSNCCVMAAVKRPPTGVAAAARNRNAQQNSTAVDFPYLVGLVSSNYESRDSDGGDPIFCTGTLVTSTFVLTSAHCTLSLRPKVQSYRRLSETALEYRTTVDVYVHPGYNNALRLNDLALITLAEPFSGVDRFAKLSAKVFRHRAEMDCVVTGIGAPHGHSYWMSVRAKFGQTACRVPKSNLGYKFVINYTWTDFLCTETTGGTASSHRQSCNQGDALICDGDKQYGAFGYGYSLRPSSMGDATSECGNPYVQSRHVLVNKHVKWIAKTVSDHLGQKRKCATPRRRHRPAETTPATRPAAVSTTVADDGSSSGGPADYPYLVYLEGRPGEPTCGGSLISPLYVLTSAYCTTRMTRIKVTTAQELQVNANFVYEHSDFNLNTLTADISIVVLQKPLNVAKYATFSNFPKSPVNNNNEILLCETVTKRRQTSFRQAPLKIKYGPNACRTPSNPEVQTVVSRTWREFSCGILKHRFRGHAGGPGDPLICDGRQYGVNSHSYQMEKPRGKSTEQLRYLVVSNYKKWIDDVRAFDANHRVELSKLTAKGHRPRAPSPLLFCVVVGLLRAVFRP